MPARAQHSPPLAASASVQPVHYADLPLNRAAELRSQSDQLQALLAHPSTLLLPLRQGRALVGPAEVAQRRTAVQLKLSTGQRLPLTPISFASLGSSSAVENPADGSQPKLLPLVLEGARSGGALEAALSGAVDSAMGFVFLGLTRHQHAVFACELSEAGTVVAAANEVSGRTSMQSGQEPGPGSSTPLSAAPEGLPGSTALTSAASGAACAAAASEAKGDATASSKGSATAPACDDAPLAEGCVWADVRVAGQEMTGPDAAVLALATGLAKWHASAAFCGRTGQPLVAVQGGYARAAGGTQRGPVGAIYPRVDPAVIVAATCGGDWLLLGRKKAWDKGRYSLLAGFCELGETLEQAAVREVLEESGIQLDLKTLSYHSSQPWPFPCSLMIGFTGSTVGAAGRGEYKGPPFHLLSEPGRAAAHEAGLQDMEILEYLLPQLPPVKVEEEELEDVRWFHRSYLLAALGLVACDNGGSSGGGGGSSSSSGGQLRHFDPRYYPRPAADGFRIPGRQVHPFFLYALANRIITSWLQQQMSGGGSSGSCSDTSSNATEEPAWLGNLLPEVSIDEGTFKYVLLRVTEGEMSSSSPGSDTQASLGPAVPYDGALDNSSGDLGAVGSTGVAPTLQASPAGAAAAPGAVEPAPAVPHLPQSKLIVRGDSRAPYHDHILRATLKELATLAPPGSAQQLKVETVGGGRIEHYPEQRLLSVYGYSSAFGQAPHEVTAALLRRWFPLHDITVSYDGY
ncbi:hypothetical protein N2152v2_000411 [Parachlorella kessleri]